jgi:hypothetical protein
MELNPCIHGGGQARVGDSAIAGSAASRISAAAGITSPSATCRRIPADSTSFPMDYTDRRRVRLRGTARVVGVDVELLERLRHPD